MTRPLFIFDLDGTLADCTHRLHFIQQTPKDWAGFFSACKDDKAVLPVIETMRGLQVTGDVEIWTGRSEEARPQTNFWFRSLWLGGIPLRMRKAGDHRHDDVLKKEWLNAMAPEERSRLTAVFEDRARVVQMWRQAGVTCFQVAAGEF